ncbi:MAG: hypothetical protein HYT72_01915 [Candidatus Aenigmarchaeota archaeon]|nr:hypothetical protein [Candidatus Aenigmarchaeota archaeon]
MGIGNGIAEYTGKALDVIKASPGYAVNLVKRHPHVAAGVAATAGAAALQVGMNTAGLLGPDSPLGGYNSRFIPYFLNSLSCAELNERRARENKGRDLTFSERMKAYAIGAALPMVAWESWENIGTTEPVYDALKRAFGEIARQDFPGKGWGSLIDTGLAVGGVMAIETVKEGIGYASKLVRR